MILLIHYFLENSTTALFWASGIAGTTLFGLRVLMALLGGMYDMAHHDSHSFDGDHGHHSVPSFKIFTLHSLAGFFMMFGWSGLACINQYHLSATLAFIVAFIIGFFVMVLTACIFRAALMLENEGSRFTLCSALDHVGTVYQRIPDDGPGKIHVTVHGVSRELYAQSHTKTPIESFTHVKIVKILDGDMVEVIQL